MCQDLKEQGMQFMRNNLMMNMGQAQKEAMVHQALLEQAVQFITRMTQITKLGQAWRRPCNSKPSKNKQCSS